MKRSPRRFVILLYGCLALVAVPALMGAEEPGCTPVPIEPPDPSVCGVCPANRPHCDEIRGVCVECLADVDCAGHPAGANCDEHVGLCGASLCIRDEECTPPATICTNAYDLFRTGFCVDACAPFVADGGCAPDEWCFPSMRTPEAGICTPDHPAALPAGAPCDRMGLDLTPGACAPGHMCWQPDGEARCFLLCDPAAAPGDEGATCAAGEQCRQLRFEVPAGSRLAAFGVCAP